MPESFKVLVKELQSLGLAIEVINEEERASAEEAKEATEGEGEEVEMPKLEAALGTPEEAAEAPKAEVEAEATEEDKTEAPKAEVEAEAAEKKPKATKAKAKAGEEEKAEATKAKAKAKAKDSKAEPEVEEESTGS
ncbi:DNA-directed RNA polymerase subunit beta [subsurface metagenome]